MTVFSATASSRFNVVPCAMQSQQASTENEGGGDRDEEDGGIAGILERTRKGNEALQQQLADYEQENGRLSNDLTKTSRELEKVSTSERKLHDALTALRKEHALLQAELKEKTALLDRVKGFMQAHQVASAVTPFSFAHLMLPLACSLQ